MPNKPTSGNMSLIGLGGRLGLYFYTYLTACACEQYVMRAPGVVCRAKVTRCCIFPSSASHTTE